MDTEPVSGPAWDEDPAPDSDGPGQVTPDWMDEAEWTRYCAAGDEDPPGEDEELYSDPQDGSLEVITAQAQADGAEHAALMARLIAAGLDGYAHRRGAAPVPGVFSGPAAGFGQGMCLDAAVPCSTLSGMADDASGADRAFAGVTDDELMGLVGTRQRLQALTPEEARAAEAILFAQSDVNEMTWGMIRDRIARAVIEVNPEAAVKRREQAAKQRRVEVLPEDSGNEMLAGRELPPAAVLAASQLLTARARQLRKAGIRGGMDELRVQAYLEKLGVLDPLAAAGARQGPNGTPDPGGNSGPGPGGTDPGHPGPAGGAGGGPAGGAGAGPGEVPAGFAARTNLTLPLATLLELAERPGFMPGIGAVDPDPEVNTLDRYRTETYADRRGGSGIDILRQRRHARPSSMAASRALARVKVMIMPWAAPGT